MPSVSDNSRRYTRFDADTGHNIDKHRKANLFVLRSCHLLDLVADDIHLNFKTKIDSFSVASTLIGYYGDNGGNRKNHFKIEVLEDFANLV